MRNTVFQLNSIYFITGHLQNTKYFSHKDNYNFPPVSDREVSYNHKSRVTTSHQRSSPWRSSNVSCFSRDKANISTQSSGKAGHEKYCKTGSQINGSLRKTYAKVSHPKQLMSKLTIRAIK